MQIIEKDIPHQKQTDNFLKLSVPANELRQRISKLETIPCPVEYLVPLQWVAGISHHMTRVSSGTMLSNKVGVDLIVAILNGIAASNEAD
jgi:hypothetical protein